MDLSLIELWSDVDWGSAPAWFGLIAASAAAIFTGRNVCVDRGDRRQKQAAEVSAWPAKGDPRSPEMQEQSLAKPSELRTGAFLRNASGSPVYDVRIVWRQEGGGSAEASLPVLAPNDAPVFIALPRPQEIMERVHRDFIGGPSPDELTVELRFRDSKNRTWSRSGTGELKDEGKRP